MQYRLVSVAGSVQSSSEVSAAHPSSAEDQCTETAEVGWKLMCLSLDLALTSVCARQLLVMTSLLCAPQQSGRACQLGFSAIGAWLDSGSEPGMRNMPQPRSICIELFFYFPTITSLLKHRSPGKKMTDLLLCFRQCQTAPFTPEWEGMRNSVKEEREKIGNSRNENIYWQGQVAIGW